MKDFTFLVGDEGMVLKSMRLTFSKKPSPYPGDEGMVFRSNTLPQLIGLSISLIIESSHSYHFFSPVMLLIFAV